MHTHAFLPLSARAHAFCICKHILVRILCLKRLRVRIQCLVCVLAFVYAGMYTCWYGYMYAHAYLLYVPICAYTQIHT